MNKISCYNGILYKIEYKPELSQKDYTQRHVYHIKTNDKDYLLYFQKKAQVSCDIL